jgi:hypothetical protein
MNPVKKGRSCSSVLLIWSQCDLGRSLKFGAFCKNLKTVISEYILYLLGKVETKVVDMILKQPQVDSVPAPSAFIFVSALLQGWC